MRESKMKFYFQGKEGSNSVDGVEEAVDEATARQQLEGRGIEIDFIEEADEPGTVTATSSREPGKSKLITRVTLSDVDWPLSSILAFQIKWALASVITALIFLPVLWVFASLFGLMLRDM